MVRRRVNTTKLEIIQAATRMFLDRGYSATSVKAIADSLDMSPGHLTFYFPTKEHLLAELVDILCDFQWSVVQQLTQEGKSLLSAICLELTAMAAICDDNDIAKDFYLSTYTHAATLEIIRKNDAQRAKLVFAEYCEDWSDEQFAEAEILVSGIEYATLMTTGNFPSVAERITGALEWIFRIYNVPKDIRDREIRQALMQDYSSFGRKILQELIEFVEATNEQAFEDLLRNKRK